MSDLKQDQEKLDKLYGKLTGGETYSVKYTHMFQPSDKDVGPDIVIPGNAFSNKNTLAKALRKLKVLSPGGRIREFRVEGNKVIVFPGANSVYRQHTSQWHSITLES